MDLCVSHQLSSWDALVLNVAAGGGARLLLTENLNPCFCWRDVKAHGLRLKAPRPAQKVMVVLISPPSCRKLSPDGVSCPRGRLR
jgi:hypothetical protein